MLFRLNVLRKAFVVAAGLCLLLVAPALNAQQPPGQTVLARPHAGMLLERASDTPLYCAVIPGEDAQLRAQGIVTRYQFQLPFTWRQGTLGLDAQGRLRYLLVSIELGGQVWAEFHSMSASFRPDGSIEVGRRLIRYIGEGAPAEQFGGLLASDPAQAIALARDLQGRCVRGR